MRQTATFALLFPFTFETQPAVVRKKIGFKVEEAWSTIRSRTQT